MPGPVANSGGGAGASALVPTFKYIRNPLISEGEEEPLDDAL